MFCWEEILKYNTFFRRTLRDKFLTVNDRQSSPKNNKPKEKNYCLKNQIYLFLLYCDNALLWNVNSTLFERYA